jgi:hypothetical protein
MAQATSRNDLNPPNNPGGCRAINTIKKKYSWVSPVRNGKAVPLNKSVLLVMKGCKLFDLLAPEPQLRPADDQPFPHRRPDQEPTGNPTPFHIFSPNVGELDADDDGFSNLEEFNAKTNPRDANSMPPLTNKAGSAPAHQSRLHPGWSVETARPSRFSACSPNQRQCVQAGK